MLCDGRRAFVNCTRDTLIKGLVTLLPSTTTVVEVLESVPADPDVVSACRTLKEAGYMIALDDYVANDPREALAEMADIIKVEMQLTTEEQQSALIKQFGPWRCRMLAEKIETRAEFVRARDQGFVYFQGYFFRRPEMMNTRDMPANRMNYLRMLQEVSRPDLELPELEKLIKAEASVCYRLLRYLNSAMFGFGSEIHSVRHALSMLGERDVRRWVRLVAAVGAGAGEDQRFGAVGTGAGAVWRISGAACAARGVGLIFAGLVVVDRRHDGNADGGSAGENSAGSCDEGGAAGEAERVASGVPVDAGA